MKAFIENEAGSDQKNIYDEATFTYKKSYTVSARYPFAYGFLLGTKSGDGDGLDCFVLTDKPLRQGETIEIEPIGMFEEIEDGEEDHKILAVPVGQTWDIDEELRRTFTAFSEQVFSHLPGKKKVVGRFLGLTEAEALINRSRI